MLGGLAACVAAGVLVAAGMVVLAGALIVFVVAGALIVLERRRIAPLLWAAVAVTAPLQGVRVGPLLAVSDVLLVLALLAILPDARLRRRRVVPRGVVVAFGLLVISGLIGTFFAASVTLSLVNLFKIVLAAAGSVVAMVLWDPGARHLRRFAWLWLVGATASAVWAAATPRSFVGRSLGLTTHPNHFGLVCVLGVGLALGLAFSSSGRARWVALGSAAILALGVGLSGSRSGLLGLVFTIAAIGVLTRRFRLFVAIGVFVTLGSMAVIAGLVDIPESNALSRITGGGGSELSDAERRQVSQDAFATIGRHPFTGTGFELAQAAHSIYLQALVVGGVPGLVSFLCVCGLIVRAGLRAVRTRRGQRDGQLVAGLTAGYFGYLSSGAFDNILWDRYLWTYLGLLIVLSATPGSDEPLGPRPATDVSRPAFARRGPAHQRS